MQASTCRTRACCTPPVPITGASPSRARAPRPLGSGLAADFLALVEREGADTIAAFIGEPLMGCGGVIPPPPTYWERIQRVCRDNDILVIADEVINGFGRTGNPLGCDTYGIEPDIVVLSKQITSSYFPLAAVLVNEPIFEAVAQMSERIGTFGQGFTGTGHPVPMAVANANLNLITKRDLMGHAGRMSPHLFAELHKLADHPHVGDVRGAGLIAAVEFVGDKSAKTPFVA